MKNNNQQPEEDLVWHFKCKSCDAEIYINAVLFDLSRECILSCVVCNSTLSCQNFDPYCIIESGIKKHFTVGFKSDELDVKIDKKGE